MRWLTFSGGLFSARFVPQYAASMATFLIRKIEQFAPLSESDRRVLDSLVATARTRDLSADQDIARDGERPSECCLILEGFACRYKLLPSGRRQILSFHLAGDI